MFLRTSRSGGHTYLRLVESYRDGSGKTRHRQIAQLGRLDQIPEEQIRRLIEGLSRISGIPAPRPMAEPRFAPAREVGGPWLFTELWQELGLKAALRRALRSSRRQFDAEALVRVMVLNRLCDPDSKLGVLRWLPTVVIPGIDTTPINHQQLLRAMDALVDHRERLEAALSTLLRPLLDQELSVVFYDLTTIKAHGEGAVDEDLRRFGYSKDFNGTARQWVLGLVQTAEGLPIAHEVFPGNVAEVRTLLPMLRSCLKRYPIRRVIVVADRGLLSLDNLDELKGIELDDGRALEYILAVPASRYGDFAEILDELPVASDRPDVAETLWNEHRLVVAHDPDVAAQRSGRRRERVEEIAAFGDALAAKLDAQDEGVNARGRRASDRGAYQRFSRRVLEARLSRFVKADLAAEQFSFHIDEAAMAAAEQLDGKLVLVTNVADLAAETIVERYKSLADIERSFRVLKSDIEIAPVYHRLPERIRAHAMICFLSLLLHRVLRLKLRSREIDASVAQVLDRLRTIQYHQVEIESAELNGLTSLTPEQRDLFDGLGLEKPTKQAL